MQVVKEILTIEERQAPAIDVEEGGGSISQDDDERLRKALVSLCLNGYMEHNKLRPRFKKIASETCEEQGESFEYFESLLA
jgi:hypothetical protein